MIDRVLGIPFDVANKSKSFNFVLNVLVQITKI